MAVDVIPDAFSEVIKCIDDKSITLINKIKLMEALCKITIRLGELLPHYVEKFNIINILCHLCSSRSRVQDYIDSHAEIDNCQSSSQLKHDWKLLRASSLSSINDIILTLGPSSAGHHLKIIDISLGILQHEYEESVVLRRTALYVLHSILFVNSRFDSLDISMQTRKLLKDKLQYVNIFLQNMLVNAGNGSGENDLICKHHVHCCLSLYRR